MVYSLLSKFQQNILFANSVDSAQTLLYCLPMSSKSTVKCGAQYSDLKVGSETKLNEIFPETGETNGSALGKMPGYCYAS